MSETTNFYRRPGPTSDLGRRRQVVPGLPADPEALSVIVRGLLIHNLEAKIRGPQLPDDRMAHVQTVGAEAILDNVISLDPGPLGRNRPAERRMIGFCYHFALLHCALLRATGTPARARSGFAGYLEAQRWIDHWVVEYWDGDSWRLTDPQTGRTGLTHDDFQDGPTAWNQCRGGGSMPALYGNTKLWGWDELRGSLINDVAALNKVEVAGWYWCDRIRGGSSRPAARRTRRVTGHPRSPRGNRRSRADNNKVLRPVPRVAAASRRRRAIRIAPRLNRSAGAGYLAH